MFHENSGYPIGVCRRILAKRGFKWVIQPWFNIFGIDQSALDNEFDNDIEAGRMLAWLYNKVESYRKRTAEENANIDIYVGDIMPFSDSD